MKTMVRLPLYIAILCLCGCPTGTPRGHDRPHGHQDPTIAISPTNDAILFNATGTGGRDLFLLDLRDHTVSRITDSQNDEVALSFSPDGKTVVYAAGVPGDRADHLFTIARSGGVPEQLTNIDANDDSPRVSPNGSMIVFVRDKTYAWGGLASNWENGGVICVVHSDGTGERQLTPEDDFAFEPFFSSGSYEELVGRVEDAGSFRISDVSERISVIEAKKSTALVFPLNSHKNLSSDSQSVIYFTLNGCFSIPIDGSGGPTKLGPTANTPDLSADGMRIVFSDGKYSPDHELFITNLDGTSRSRSLLIDSRS